MSDQARRSGPLSGLRIVEFAGIGPGPYAAMLLADMGAEIIRLDRKGGADPYIRHVLYRGRASLEVDLKDQTTRDGVLDLLDHADGLIEGFRPGVMERLGLGPDIIHARNKALVYGRMTGWGQEGPLAQCVGHDVNYIAITGALAAIGPAARPSIPLNLLGDFGGGSLFLVMGMLAALIHAGKTGEGQVVDAAICDGVTSLMAMFAAMQGEGNWSRRREDNLLDGGAPFYAIYECADGKHISVGALEPQFYDDLCRRVGFGSHDRFDRKDWPRQRQAWAELFKARSRDEWAAMLEGTEACVAPVLDYVEAQSHPHLQARKAHIEIDGIIQPAPAPRFSKTPSQIGKPLSRTGNIQDLIARWSV